MTNNEIRRLIHPRQGPRFFLALLFSLLTAILAIVLSIVSYGILVLYVLLFVFVFWIVLNVLYATFVANAVKVSPRNYPEIASLVAQTRSEIGLSKPVDVFVYQSGEFNAFFRRFFAKRAIFINSELLTTGVTQAEVKWIIARFVGQVKVKHMLGPVGWLINFAQRLIIFNIFILPYERATAYTGDRIALASIGGDISSAVDAMNKLLVGRSLGYSIDPSGIIEQNKSVKGSFFAFLARIGNMLPHTLPRYVDLISFSATAFPTQFRRFAAENPSLQSLVTGHNDALVDVTPIVQSSTTRQGTRRTNDATFGDLNDVSFGGFIALPFVLAAIHALMQQFLFANDIYGVFGSDSHFLIPLAYLVTTLIPLLIIMPGYARKTYPMGGGNAFIGAAIAILVCLPLGAVSALEYFDLGEGIEEYFLSGNLFNASVYLRGLGTALSDTSLPVGILILTTPVLIVLVKESAFRGFLTHQLQQSGAGSLKVFGANLAIETAFTLSIFVISAGFQTILGIMRGYGLSMGFENFIIDMPRTLLVSLIWGLVMTTIRLVSGRLWPCWLAAGLSVFAMELLLWS